MEGSTECGEGPQCPGQSRDTAPVPIAADPVRPPKRVEGPWWPCVAEPSSVASSSPGTVVDRGIFDDVVIRARVR